MQARDPFSAFNPSEIDVVVFDLGGVLYEIEPARSLHAFHALAERSGVPLPVDRADDLFVELETGRADAETWAESLRERYGLQADTPELVAALNALLIGPAPGRVELLDRLRSRYRLALLSNTNRIHHEVFAPQCAGMFGRMERLFFSFDLGLRKPDAAVYRAARQLGGFDPARTLFIDDNADNVRAAQADGWHARRLARMDGLEGMLQPLLHH